MQMAIKYATEKQFNLAENILRNIIVSNDKFHPAFHMLGQLAFQKGQDDIAAQYYHKATTLDGNLPQYQLDFAESLYYLGKPQEALMAVNRSIQLDVNNPKSHFIAGNALMNIGENEQAKKAFIRTIKLDPKNDFAYNNLGTLYENGNEICEAKKNYQLAIKINNRNTIALNNLATILIAEGNFETAKELLNEAIRIQPDYILAHNSISSLKKYRADEEHTKILISLLKSIKKMSISDQIRLHYNLGKVYADIQDYDKAFHHYRSSNTLNRSTYDYNEDTIEYTVQKIKTVFSDIKFEKNKTAQKNETIPIFIVGMPRSGSTLIEQILASHSAIESGGELKTLSDTIIERIGKFPNNLKNFTDEELRNIGKEYLNKLKEIHPEARFIIDKMPGNFQYAGLIAKILPQAKIINSTRNPMDCCLSNYIQLFQNTVPYSNDLSELGRYFKIYTNLMRHWHSILPDDLLYDISYEDIIDNLEKEARNVVEFIGLDWEEKCLEFHKSNTLIKTASAAQVRKPIYNSSIGKWKIYKKHLEPLINALSEK